MLKVFCILQETFSCYLCFTVSTNVVSSILSCYLLLTLPMLQKPMEESYKEYIALTILLVSVNVNFFSLVKHCDKGKLKLVNLFAYTYRDL